MPFSKSELFSACLEVAENTLWDHKHPPTHQEVKELANLFFKEADGIGEALDESGLCPNENPIVPAVRYLAYAHAIPPMGNNTKWFYSMLTAVTEFCCPNLIHTEKSSEIFLFLKKGVEQSINETKVNIDKAEKEDIDKLLDFLDPSLKFKRIGAWQTFNSENPDRLSQASNSMVELLDKVIGKLCQNISFAEFLKQNFESDKEIKWAESMRKFVGNTKSNLHRIKHHDEYKDIIMVETLLSVAEKLIHFLITKGVKST